MNLLAQISILVFISITTITQKCSAKQLSYCDRSLCPNGGKHIACNNHGYFGPSCPDDAVIIDVTPYKRQFVHAHNKRRNWIALGLLPGYYPAAKMATMIWDKELAYLAELNLKTCILDHDQCLNTFRFKNSGQCLIGLNTSRTRPLNMTAVVEESVEGWFSEYKTIDHSYITKFRVKPNFDDYGHFTEIVVDRNTHVGCAAIRFTRPDYPYYYNLHVACNYASVHHTITPLYHYGLPASKCKTGRNPHYPGLCSLREKFNPNY